MSRTIRKLGLIESQMSLFHARKRGTTQATHVVELAGEPDGSRLAAAARHLFRKYQILRCRVVENGDGMFFEETAAFEDVSLLVTLAQKSPFDLQGHVEMRLNQALDPSVSL